MISKFFKAWAGRGHREDPLGGPTGRVVFLTFANTGFMSTRRVVNEARGLGVFDEIIALTEHDIPDYISLHSKFIEDNPSGYGCWIWKPKIIWDALERMPDGDVLVYADAGTHINSRGVDRFRDYMRCFESWDMVNFASSSHYKGQYYVKMDAVMAYHPRFRKRSTPYSYAGLMMIRNSARSRAMIHDWLTLCQRYAFLDRSRSVSYKEARHYRANDCDMGLFNLCLDKHRISHVYYPDEVNVCVEDGRQFIHTGAPYEDCDWSVLDHVPFQIRRLAPDKVSNPALLEGK